MSWGKMAIVLLLSIFFILNNVASGFDSNSTRIGSAVCITNGVIWSGEYINLNLSQYSFEPVGGSCTPGLILLQPGVSITSNGVNFQSVGQKGLCVTRGYLIIGFATTIGSPFAIGNNINNLYVCSSSLVFQMQPGDYVTLKQYVYLEVQQQNITFFVQDSPLLSNIGPYTYTRINQSVCIESGVLVNGITATTFINNETIFDQVNGVCPNGTISLGFGIQENDSSKPAILSNNKCLSNSVIITGRVIVTGELTPNGEVIKSGKFAGLNCTIPSFPNSIPIPFGVEISSKIGVYIITPLATSTTASTTGSTTATTRTTARYTYRPRVSTKYVPYEYNRPNNVVYRDDEYKERKQSNNYNYYYPQPERRDIPRRNKAQPKKSERDRPPSWQRQVDKLRDYIDAKMAAKSKNNQYDLLFRSNKKNGYSNEY